MKLRIKSNTLRFRLTKSDVSLFREKGFIEEKTEFPGAVFYYALKTVHGSDEITAEYKDNRITVYMPENWVHDWPEARVGFDHEMPLGNGESLYILIEKDFKCLESTREDQSDNFENPKEHC